MLSLDKRISKLSLEAALGHPDSRISKTEGRFRLRHRDLPGYLGNILVKLSPDVVIVAEDERLLQLKTHGDDISRILLCESTGLINFELVLEEEFLVIWSSLIRSVRMDEVFWTYPSAV